MMWQDSVERVDRKVDANFKWTVGVFGAGFMALLSAFAAGFVLLSGRVESVATRVEDGNARVLARLDTVSAQVADLRIDVAVLKANRAAQRR